MTPPDSSVRQRTLADYLAIVRRRKWIAIIPLLLVPTAAYFYSAQQPKLYGATAEVLLSRQDLGSSLAGIQNADVFTDPDRYAETQVVLARVPEVARRAVEQAGVRGLTSGELQSTSSIRSRGNADLLQFTVDHPDPDVAATLATAYARAFSRFRLELDTATLSSARLDLDKSVAALRRQGLTDTTLYRELSRRSLELKTMELLQTAPEVVRIPDEGNQVAPTPKRSAMLGVALGLLLGLGAAFLWEMLDKRLRDEEEIQRTLGIPLLARLPSPRTQKGRDLLAMLDNPSDAEAEAIRRFRSNVEFANLDHGAKVLMITSALSGEGKSVTVSNLAVALARAGRRVILVDLDLRKPTVGRLFGLGYRPGLTDVAIERVGLEQALVPVSLATSDPVRFASRRAARKAGGEAYDTGMQHTESQGSLWVLPAGFLPASPGELVGTQAVAGVLASLKERVDFVLVDAPPLLAVSDAVTLSRRVDAFMVVVRLGMVDRAVLRELGRQLEAIPTRKLGFVLAGATTDEQYGVGNYGYGAAERDQAQLRPMDEIEDALEVPAGGRQSVR